MNENEAYSGSASGRLETAADKASGARPTIGEAATEAAQAALREAKTLGGDAQQAAEHQADKVKDIASSQMDAFADALRAASDQLSKNQSGPAAEMVAHAASGLEGLSRSLHGKSTGEMIESVRHFGRSNPIGFLAGSVLAGLALGRFAAAGSSGTAAAPGQTTRQPSGENVPPAAASAHTGREMSK